MPLEDFIINMYCCVADSYEELVKSQLRTRGFQTKLTDSEVLTLEIVGEFMGKDADKQIWSYFRSHWLAWFVNLWQIKERILRNCLQNLTRKSKVTYFESCRCI